LEMGACVFVIRERIYKCLRTRTVIDTSTTDDVLYSLKFFVSTPQNR
jgi:hypothetical protein